MCTLSYRDEAAHAEEDFFGVRKYCSNYELAKALEMLVEVVEVSPTAGGWEDELEVGKEGHPLVLARRGALDFPRHWFTTRSMAFQSPPDMGSVEVDFESRVVVGYSKDRIAETVHFVVRHVS